MPNGRAPRHRPGRRGEAGRGGRSGQGGRSGRGGARAGRRRRYLRALAALPVGLVVLVGGLFLIRSPGHPQTTAGTTAAPGTVTAQKTAAPCGAADAGGAPCAVGSVSVATVPTGHPGPAPVRARRAVARSAPSPAAPAGRAAGAPAASHAGAPAAQAAQAGTPADQVLALINQARAQAGLPALVFSAALDRSASAHNQTMARGCGLSHQCAGEPALGARETSAGARWTSAGENIGEGGPEPATTAAIAQTAVGLTQDMLNEKPPDDGHRRNILNSSFGHIGIAVYRDSGGMVWMTQDFSS
jgi:uncharacterized protein YkwD